MEFARNSPVTVLTTAGSESGSPSEAPATLPRTSTPGTPDTYIQSLTPSSPCAMRTRRGFSFGLKRPRGGIGLCAMVQN